MDASTCQWLPSDDQDETDPEHHRRAVEHPFIGCRRVGVDFVRIRTPSVRTRI
jgi:hypothetical protein